MPLPLLVLPTGELVAHHPASGDADILVALEIPPFTPVPVRNRRDGWTAAKQRRFLIKLIDCASVRAAAGAVGMTAKSAYRLKARPDAEEFSASWDVAVAMAGTAITSFLLDRAIEGEIEPVMYRGQQIGERRVHNVGELVRLMRAFTKLDHRALGEARRNQAAAASAQAAKRRKVTQNGTLAPDCRRTDAA